MKIETYKDLMIYLSSLTNITNKSYYSNLSEIVEIWEGDKDNYDEIYRLTFKEFEEKMNKRRGYEKIEIQIKE